MDKLLFPSVLDNTIVSTWETCPVKCVLGHFFHLKPRGPQVHLDAGKAYAKALEVYRGHFYGKGPLKGDFEQSLVEGLRALCRSFGYDEDVDRVFEPTKKSFIRMAELYVRYFDHFGSKTDPMRPAEISGEIMVEKSFTLELGLKHPDTGEPLLYHGRYDMLADYHGGLFVYDDKTCSQLGKTWASQWDFRSQFDGYCYGARANGYPVVGAIVRGSCVYAQDVGYAESISYRKPWELDKWWQDLHEAVYNMIAYYGRMKEWEASKKEGTPLVNAIGQVPSRGKFSGACQDYGGCEMQQMCKAQNPARWVSEYQVRVWDPRNPDKDEN